MRQIFKQFCKSSIAALWVIPIAGLPARADGYADQIPPPPPAVSVPNAIPSVTAPAVPSAAAYRVVLNSDRADWLAIAKQVQPQAFLTTIGGNRVIQMGAFTTEASARKAAAQYAAKGLPASIQGIGGTISPASPSVSLGAGRSSQPIGSVITTVDKGYYVVIPVSSETANQVRAKLAQLKVPSRYLFLRQEPLGLHWAIGVYPNRQAAEKMDQYLRSQGGLDSRVFFQN